MAYNDNASNNMAVVKAVVLPRDALGLCDKIKQEREEGLQGFAPNDVGICGIPPWPRAQDKTMGFAPEGEQATIPCYFCVKSAERHADTSTMIRCIRMGEKKCSNCINMKQACNMDYHDPPRRPNSTGKLYALLYQARKKMARNLNQYLVLPTFNSEQDVIEAEFPFDQQTREIQEAFIACFGKPKTPSSKRKELVLTEPQITTKEARFRTSLDVTTPYHSTKPLKQPSGDHSLVENLSSLSPESSMSDNTPFTPLEEMPSSTQKYRGFDLPSTISINGPLLFKQTDDLDKAVKNYHQLDLTIRSALVCIGKCFDLQETLKRSHRILRDLPRQKLEHLGTSSESTEKSQSAMVSAESRLILATYGEQDTVESEAGPSRKRSRVSLPQQYNLIDQRIPASELSGSSDQKEAGTALARWLKDLR